MENKLSKNFYNLDELKNALPQAIKNGDDKIAVYIVGELKKSLVEKDFNEFMNTLGEYDGKTAYPFICKLLNTTSNRQLTAYYNHASKELPKRRKITIPDYGITTRDTNLDSLYKACKSAVKWSDEELRKSHLAKVVVVPCPTPAASSVEEEEEEIEEIETNYFGDVDAVVGEVEEVGAAPSTPPVVKVSRPTAAVSAIPKSVIQYSVSPTVEFNPDTMYSDRLPHLYAMPSPLPTMYQNNKFIKPIRSNLWTDELKHYTFDVQKIKELLGFKPLNIEHEMVFIKGEVYNCFVTKNLGEPCVSNALFIDRKKHNLDDVNNVKLPPCSYGPVVHMLLFRKLIACPTKTTHILLNRDTNEWVFTTEVLYTKDSSNRLFTDKYKYALEIKQHLLRYKPRYIKLCYEWRTLLGKSDFTLTPYGINMITNITKIVNFLNRNVFY